MGEETLTCTRKYRVVGISRERRSSGEQEGAGWAGRELVPPREDVVGRIMAPQDTCGICDYVTVHGRKNFADGIKVKDLKIGAPNNHMSP